MKWFRIFWRALAYGLFIGLFVSNLLILKNNAEQREERNEATESLLKSIDENTDDIKTTVDDETEDTNKLVRGQEKTQRLLACLIVVHDIDIQVSQAVREECEKDIKAVRPNSASGEQNPPESSGNDSGSSSGGSNSPQPSNPPEEKSLLEQILDPMNLLRSLPIL